MSGRMGGAESARRSDHAVASRTCGRNESMKVLIAEDELFFSCMLEGALRDLGYEVVSVSDGESAWEILQRPDSPKLAILDWQMPGISGPDLCRRIRTNLSPEPTYV